MNSTLSTVLLIVVVVIAALLVRDQLPHATITKGEPIMRHSDVAPLTAPDSEPLAAQNSVVEEAEKIYGKNRPPGWESNEERNRRIMNQNFGTDRGTACDNTSLPPGFCWKK